MGDHPIAAISFPAASDVTETTKVGLLLRTRAIATRNRIATALLEGPVRMLASLVLIGLIWYGLYKLFWAVLFQLHRTPLEATVAIPMVFNFFFVAMLALLAFSNAIILYNSLFSPKEAAYLLTLPLNPRDLITLKYIESLVLASWSLVLLGFPMMFAIVDTAGRPGIELYLAFLAFFLAFIPIPGAMGLLIAWGIARYFPRRLAKAAAIIAGLVLGASIASGFRSLSLGETATELWLREFLLRMSFLESALLPNHWVASGIDEAVAGHFPESLRYLGVTFVNALFLSWVAVVVVSRDFLTAYDRSSSSRSAGRRTASPASGGVAGLAFFYLPRPLRLIAAKDLRTFVRDPEQWSQLAILFGLLVLYLTNMPNLRLEFSRSGSLLIIPFLNICAVSLILATFTCRFVFPMVSLEGQKLWCLGVFPLQRGRVLRAKFAFALTVTLAAGWTAMTLAAVMLNLSPLWSLIHLAVTAAVCVGLCGLAVGIGARLPSFGQTSAARIANGLGGTVNLLASIALVSLILAGVGIASWRTQSIVDGDLPDLVALLWCGGAIAFALIVGRTTLRMGERHFERTEI
ncbi:MAG: hypothetical protein HY287_15310 [Planctomycetes bacterium]|nr:hypothetical protein [Planctomycetota bacterium]